MKRCFFLLSFVLLSIFGFAQESDWEPLLDKDLSKWDVFVGVPHHSVKGLPEGTPTGDGMKGESLGLNNDPLKVFYAEDIDGETIMRVSGEIYAGLTSKEVYENYHLKFKFKWGELKWEPRLKAQRDNGLLYHCIGEHGAFWNVWMQSQEFQIQERDMGDYYGLAGGVNTIKAEKREDGFHIYNPEAESVKLGTVIPGDKMYRCVRSENKEKPHGEWNTLELVCFNGKSYHIVNGYVVMILEKAESHKDGEFTFITKGKIQFQSEAAECYYKDMHIKKLSALPDFLKK